MGLCFSKDEVAAAPTHGGRLDDETHQQRNLANVVPGSSPRPAGTIPPPDADQQQQSPAAPMAASRAADDASQSAIDDERAYCKIIQRMGLLSNHPLLAIYEATEAIAGEVGADLVSISAFMDNETECSVLLAAYGEGSAMLERNMAVYRGSDTGGTIARLVDAAGGRVSVPDATSDEKLPADLAALYRGAGLTSFEALTIATPGGAPLGTLLVGKAAPNGFGTRGESLLPTLAAAIASLVPLLRQRSVLAAAKVVQQICSAPDAVTAIKELLRGVTTFMFTQENVPVEPRLALLEAGPESDKALMFEPAREEVNQLRHRREGGLSLPGSASKEVAVREIELEGTLLHQSIKLKRASVVHDTPIYIQNSACPARDVLSTSSDATSLALVPLMMAGTPLGALYIAPTMRIDFGNIQETLLGLVLCLTPAIYNKLDGDIMALVAQAKRASQDLTAACSNVAPGSPQPSEGRAPAADALASERGATANGTPMGNSQQQTPQASVVPFFSTADRAGETEAHRLEVIPEQRVATVPMMKVLQREIRRGRRCSMELSFTSDLAIEKEIGRGGFGTVYRGTWRNAPAAIKVTNARAHNGDAVPDAMELAVLSSVSHPNIVQLLSLLLNMVAAEDDSPYSASLCAQNNPEPGPPGSKRLPQPPRFSRIPPNEPKPKGPTFNLIVLEYCDRGSLRDAIKSGIFHCRLDETGRIGVHLASITEVLLDIATAMQYLHDGANLVHGDLKLDNVLLKSDPDHLLGFTAKLGDFGLSKVLNNTETNRQVINRNGAGTVNHMAPEMFTAGTTITTAVDVYAWGILMYEAFTGRRAFAGMSSEAIMQRVVQRNMRPAFPSGTPAAYVELASRCWSRNPANRPPFAEIILSLRKMRTTAGPVPRQVSPAPSVTEGSDVAGPSACP